MDNPLDSIEIPEAEEQRSLQIVKSPTAIRIVRGTALERMIRAAVYPGKHQLPAMNDPCRVAAEWARKNGNPLL